MASGPAGTRLGDTPYGTRHMRMEAAPIPLRAVERVGFTASRRNEPPRIPSLVSFRLFPGDPYGRRRDLLIRLND